MNLDRRLLGEARAVSLYLALAVGTGLLGGIAIILQARYLSRAVTAVFLEGATQEGLRATLGILLAVIVARAGLVWIKEVLAARAAGQIKARLRERLFARLLDLGPIHASGERTGELTNTLVEGVEALDAYFSQYLPNLALAALVPVAILLFVFPLDPLTGIVFLLTAPLIPLFMVLIGKLADLLTRRQWESLSRMNAHFLDVLQGLTTLKLFNRSRAQIETIAIITDRFRDTTLGVLRVAFLSALVLEIVGSISTAIVAVEVGLRLVYSTISFEEAFFILVLAPEFYLPLRNLGASFHAGMSGVAAARRIYEVLGEPEWESGRGGEGERVTKQSEQDVSRASRNPIGLSCSPLVSHSPTLPVSPSPTPPLPHSRISFRDVHLSYEGGERSGIKGVSFEIAAGEKVALVGPSGSGKSSIASLLLSFVEPDQGEILIDDVPLRDVPLEEWREQVAWVPQSPYLFATTVAENIRLGRPAATDEEVRRAAEMAGAGEFVEQLSRGYDTPIGERGARLSGGQAQRIALARAFLKDAPLLLLDEPTSNLDPENEVVVQEAIDRLMEGRTVLVIAHRLGTVRRMDRVVVMENGVVAEAGSPGELSRRDGLFRRLVGEYSDGTHSNLVGAGGPAEPPRDGQPTCCRSDGRALARMTILHDEAARGNETPEVFETSGVWPRPLPLSPSPRPPFSSWAVFWRLVKLVAPFKWWMALSALLGFATVGSGIGLIATASFLIASAALHPSVADLAVPIVGVRFFGISRGVFRYLERYVSHNVTFRLLGRLRVWFYQAVEPLAPAHLMERRSGDLLNRVVADVETLQHFYVRVIAPPLVALMTGFVMWLFVRQFDSVLAWILIGFLLLAGIAVPLLIHVLSFDTGRDTAELRSDLNVRLVDDLQGMADLLVFGKRQCEIEGIGAINRGWLRAQRKMAWVAGLYGALSTLLANGGMWAVLVAAIPLVNAGSLGGVYLPVLALAVLASFEAVSALPLAFQQLGSSLESGRRLLEIVEGGQVSGIGGREDAETGQSVGAGGSAGPLRPDRSTQNAAFVAFDGVSFRYGPDEPLAVKGVSFELEKGRRLAIVGHSGAGKSTLVNLLVRFWDYEGSITLGGRELREYTPEEARRLIAVVPQRTHLFNATIRENLLIARPDATEEQLVSATQQARLHSFVEALPRGYDSWIGEQGMRLSGGERQRLAVARALLKDSPVLVLDEPASNLDSLTEREMMEMVWNAGAERAVLVITHRLVGLEAADEILVMSGGRVVEQGNHRQLLDSKGVFRRMWAAQNL